MSYATPPFSPSKDVHENQLAIEAMLKNLVQTDHCKLYMITLTFPEGRDYILKPSSAEQKVKRFYETVLLRLLVDRRRFHLPSKKSLQPTMFAFLDVPGSKPKSAKIEKSHHSSPNTVHYHCILAAKPEIALKLDPFCNVPNSLCLPPYLKDKNTPILKTSDCQPIDDLNSLFRVVSYASEYALRQKQNDRHENWFILP